ncbi:MAG: glycosyltransferase [Pseudomonadota bacterium]
MSPKVSVCIPVLNGAKRLPSCLKSLRDLDYPQDLIEVIIADGGSTDNTREVTLEHGARFLDNPGKTVAAGRNVSFAAATGEFIASTDDDCVVPADWITRALEEFDASDVAAVGGISLLPVDSQPWPEAANYIFRLASQSGHSVQSDQMESGDVEDLPGCNVIYRTESARGIGDFDEGLLTAEDVDFHIRLRSAGQRLRSASGLYVWHHKRPSVSGLFKQLKRYAIGRVKLGRKWPGAISDAHHVLGFAIPILGATSMIGLTLAPKVYVLLALIACALLVIFALKDKVSLKAALLTPAAGLVVATGWSFGYLKERFFLMGGAKTP